MGTNLIALLGQQAILCKKNHSLGYSVIFQLKKGVFESVQATRSKLIEIATKESVWG